MPTGPGADRGPGYRAFDADASAFYRIASDTMGETSTRVNKPAVQRTLVALRDHEPPLVWKSARGGYAIDDVTRHDWYESLVENGDWSSMSDR